MFVYVYNDDFQQKSKNGMIHKKYFVHPISTQRIQIRLHIKTITNVVKWDDPITNVFKEN